MATKIKIGHATHSATGGTTDVNPGDQLQNADGTGGEVRIEYDYDITNRDPAFTVLLRPKSAELAEMSALACENGCANSCIGYSQDRRETLLAEAEKVNYNLAAIETPCDADCSSFMAACAKAGNANLNISLSPTTSSMRQYFTKSGDYTALTDKKFFTSTDYLQRGDILVAEGSHTVMVLAGGKKIYKFALKATATGITKDIAKIKLVLLKIENGAEKPVDKEALAIFKRDYTLKYCLVSLDSHSSQRTGEISIDNYETLTISDLEPNCAYLLKVNAFIDNHEEFCSPNILFTTPKSQLGTIKNLKVTFGNQAMLKTKCDISFTEPSNPSPDGYNTSLIVNGQIIDKNNSIIRAGAGTVKKSLRLEQLANNASISFNDIIQVGVQPYINNGSEIITGILTCSEPVHIKPFLTIVDKIYLQLKDTFKRILLYGKGE